MNTITPYRNLYRLLGINSRDIAREMGISATYLHRVERGDASPTAEQKYLGDIRRILAGTDLQHVERLASEVAEAAREVSA